MRGGAQSHLMRCSDGHYYVVKFQNNPQHRRILVNELLGTRLAGRLGLPTAPVEIIEVSEELIRLTPDLAMEMPRSRIPCQAGLQFGSRNTNGRQTVFFLKMAEGSERSAPLASAHGQPEHSSPSGLRYETLMIDQGFCFNAGEWNYPDAPLRGLYTRNRVYEGVTGMASFGPWIDCVENRMTERVLDQLGREIPPAWYEDDYDALLRLLEQLHRRRTRVPDLLLEAKKSNRQPFPNWR